MSQCLACNGSGYTSPYCGADMSSSMRHIGTGPCFCCGGTGKALDMGALLLATPEEVLPEVNLWNYTWAGDPTL